MARFANRLPIGPGSRGGRWHEAEYRNAYHRAWRKANPEYRAREALRSARKRAMVCNGDPTGISSAEHFPRPLPLPAALCMCDCGCRERVVRICGFCRRSEHMEGA